jgi:hypothetical protein
MRPTYRVLVGAYASHPRMQELTRTVGLTPQMCAAKLIATMNAAPNARTRDAILSNAMACIGIYTEGEAAFDRGTEEMLRNMSDRNSTEKYALRMSEHSRHMPQFASPERVKFLRDVAAQSSLHQGVADRFREHDRDTAAHEPAPIPVNPRAQREGEDRRDGRSALMAAVSTAESHDHVRLKDEHETVRDSLRAAFSVHEFIADQADPLDDEALLRMSDSV